MTIPGKRGGAAQGCAIYIYIRGTLRWAAPEILNGHREPSQLGRRASFKEEEQDQRRSLQLGAAHVFRAYGQKAVYRPALRSIRLRSFARNYKERSVAGLAQAECHAAAALGRELRLAAHFLIGTGKDPSEMWPKGACNAWRRGFLVRRLHLDGEAGDPPLSAL